ncbi:MAG: hypothetical protein LBP40_06845 [Campylobacteraceae bacterium]|jgi:hypothetical protein|nr:hypothetical protein [Campylobacteraceae bacterium]
MLLSTANVKLSKTLSNQSFWTNIQDSVCLISLSSLTKLLVSLSVFFLFLGCGGGGGSSPSAANTTGGEDNSMLYKVSFYDEEFNFNGTVEVNSAIINIAQLKMDLNINAVELYTASNDTDISSETSYIITKDTNLYALANVTEIIDQTGLDDIRNNLAGKYILMNDIELVEGEAGFDAVLGWTPIGTFTGILNGNGYKITNIWIGMTTANIGFFSIANGALIKNLGIEISENKAISGYGMVGGIAGQINNSSIIHSYSIGNINGGNTGIENLGGIVGYIQNSNITNSYSIANVSNGRFIGGIAGRVLAGSIISNSYFAGSVDGLPYAGGIAGRIESSDIINSYSSGNVTGTQYTGGISGYALYGFIINNYSSGNVSGTQYVGGLLGMGRATITNNAAINPSVARTSTYGNRVIGFASTSSGSSISNNFARNDLDSGFTHSAESYAGIGRDDSEFLIEDTYKTGLNWSFGDNDTNPWKIEESKNNGLPYLYWQDL